MRRAQYIQSNRDLANKPNVSESMAKYYKSLSHQLAEKFAQKPLTPQARTGLYFSESKQKYLPVEYKLVIGEDEVYFALITLTGHKIPVSLENACSLGPNISSST